MAKTKKTVGDGVERERVEPVESVGSVDTVVNVGTKDTPVVDIKNVDGVMVAEEVKEVKGVEEAKTKPEADVESEKDARQAQEIEKLKAELDVARREYELLLGNQQKPAKQIFG